MVGLYRIENTASDHASILKSTVLAWGERQPDVYLVSKEGVKVYTQRIILCFYSKMVGMLVESNKDDLVGISVPASSTSLTMMLKVLVSGSVIGNNKENLLEVGQAAEALGIVLNDRQIGYRRKTQGGQTGQQTGLVKETVEISGRKVSYRKSTDVAPVPEVKTEPNEDNEKIDVSGTNAKVAKKENSKSKKKSEKRSNFLSADEVNDKSCVTCGKIFPTRGRLELHMNVHKEDKEKPFKCDVCEKGFSASASLKNHKLLHTGEVHKCEFCEYTAVQKGNLKTHRLKLHKDLLDQNEVEGNVAQDLIADKFVKVTTKEEVQDDLADSVIENDGEKGHEGVTDNVDDKIDGEEENEGGAASLDETEDSVDE